MKEVILSLTKDELVGFIKDGKYTSPSLKTEGFIHCCFLEQLDYVANKFFTENQIFLVFSNESKLRAHLKTDNGFPHLYREFKSSDIVDIKAVNKVLESYEIASILKH